MLQAVGSLEKNRRYPYESCQPKHFPASTSVKISASVFLSIKTLHTLYPELKPFVTNALELDSRHKLYFEQAGNELGLPVIFLHGGPGSGCNENHRRYFNPDKYRIILFDIP